MSYTYYTNPEKLSAKIEFNEKLTLPTNSPNICCIKNVSINTNVIGSKVVSTPLSKIVDTENLKFAKERLLIAGWVNIDVSYTSSKNAKCVNNTRFKIAFNIHIPLNKSASCCKDVFSITSNIKNICTNLCGCKSILQKFTLFLFAKKTGSITPEPPEPPVPPEPPIKKLPNAIIIKNSVNENIVSKIEFNLTDNKLIVDSTGIIPNNMADNVEYFSFKLKDRNNRFVKNSSIILSNKNANKFAESLNNTPFLYDDILELDYLMPANITITNFPNAPQNHTPIKNKEFYRITPNGLESYTPPLPPPPEPTKLPNTIIVVDNFFPEKRVATVEFNKNEKKFIITSTNAIPDRSLGDAIYFSLKLKDDTNETIKASAIIKANENANNFRTFLNNQEFEFNDILELDYLIPTKISITNFPVAPQNHTPTKNKEYFRITPEGLKAYTPPTPPPPPQPKKLPNTIIVNDNFIPKETVVTIEFNADDKILITNSTGLTPSGSTDSTLYFSFKLKDSNNQRIKENASFANNENANRFSSILNGKKFEYGDILELDYLIPKNITITNFPVAPQNHVPIDNKEYFRITPIGLMPYTPPTPPPPQPKKLPNKIIINNNISPKKIVATIEFDAANKKFLATSTGEIPGGSSSSSPYFLLFLKDSNNKSKGGGLGFTANENANKFSSDLNTRIFEFGDILELEYLIPTNITITNYPTTSQNHVPTDKKEYFRITPIGLMPYTPPTPPPPQPKKLPNKIIINNNISPKKIVATIEFDAANKKFLATSTGEIPGGSSSSSPYFLLFLKDSNNKSKGGGLGFTANENANKFSSDLNTRIFEFGDILELEYLIPANITITNYPTTSQDYIPFNKKEFFRITPQGLIPYTPPTPPPPQPKKLPNSIIVKDNFIPKDTVVTIEFNADDKILITNSTGLTPSNSPNSNLYFSFKLKDSNNQRIKESASFANNENANRFSSILNGKKFEYGDILELDYLIPKNITITNYPTTSQDYIPFSNKEFFRITPQGLIPYTPPIPPTPQPKKLPNTIIVNNNILNTAPTTVATIEFNADDKKLIITSSGIIPDTALGSNVYFLLKLKDSNNQRIKETSTIIANKNATDFKTALNGKSFEYGDILELGYSIPRNITITNYPTTSQNYIPFSNKDFFRITPQGLIPYTPPIPPTPQPKKLPNTIIVNNNILNTAPTTVATIEFNADDKKLIITSSGIIPDTALGSNLYFLLKLKDSNNQRIKEASTIIANKNATDFKTALNGKSFEYGDILELIYSIPRNITITNYPTTSQNYIPFSNKDFFRITPQGLIPYTPPEPKKLPNEIIINNNFTPKKSVAIIKFNADDKILLATSSGLTPSNSPDSSLYFSFKLKDSNNQRIKESASFANNENANRFSSILNGRKFEYGDILELDYLIPKNITITNYPTTSQDYIPFSNKEFFRITPQGLMPYTPPTPPQPIPGKLPNTIIVKNTASPKEIVATIEFNTDDKELMVTSTGIIPDRQFNNIYFSLKLKDNNNQNIKVDSTILGTQNADNFKNDLNGENFEYGNILELDYFIPNNITITNFPNAPQNHTPTNRKEFYRITPQGLQAYTPPTPPPPGPNKLPNAIIVANTDVSTPRPTVATIEFNTDDETLIVTSTGEIPRIPSTSPVYFSLKLKDSNNQNIKENSTIISNRSADDFASNLNDVGFEYGDILELDYLMPNNITITNFPNAPQNHIPTAQKEFYRITPQGLQAYTPPTPPPPGPNKLPNAIIVANTDVSTPRPTVATIEFNTDDETLIVTSTGEIPRIPSTSPVYFSLKLKDSNNQNIKENSTIISNRSADDFASNLNDVDFQYGDILELDYLMPNNITITNFPNAPQNYTPTAQKEFYRITPTGLETYTPPTPPPPEPNKLPNSIIIKNTASPKETVATIEFNIDDKELMVTSTGIIPDRALNIIYFSLKLKDNNNQNIKVDSTILGTQNANNFENDLNGENFEYGDILELDYEFRQNITVTNFPNAPQNYTPTAQKEFYRITPTGLETYTPPTPPPPEPNKLPNSIIIKNTASPKETVATIEFNIDAEELMVTSTDIIPDSASGNISYFSFKLNSSNNQITKESSIILSNENANNFESDLNNSNFEFGDILELDYLMPNNITITNFPNAPQNHIPTNRREFYRITPDGLETYTPPAPPEPTKLPNIIVVEDNSTTNKSPVAMVEFNVDDIKLIVTSTGAIPDSNLGGDVYFSFKLKDENNQNIKVSSTILANQDANNFQNALNGESFQFNDILELDYLIPDNITITNFPSDQQIYKPTNVKEFYRITPDGLETYTPPTPPAPGKLQNSIIIKDNSVTNKQIVATIEFNTDNDELIVNSSGIIPNSSSSFMYFRLTLKDSNNASTKATSFILDNQSANSFKNTLNATSFQYNDILELEYGIPSNITITNFPNAPQNYIPNKFKEYYRITSRGLESYTPTPNPNTLQNVIIIETNSQTFKQPVATIEFNTDSEEFIVISTGAIPDNNLGSDIYFSFKLKDRNNQSIKESSNILANQTANNFASDLNTMNFQYDDILELDYLIPTNINITNFPNTGQTHIPNMLKEYYRITPNGLEAYILPDPNKLPNSIIISNNFLPKQTVATIEFNSATEQLIIDSTGVIPDTISLAILYFRLTIKDNNNQTVKTSFLFPMNTNADIFRDTLNGFRFQFNDILELEYAVPANITITNFPMASQNYTPTNQIEHYRITPQGLEAYTPPPGNIIIVKDTTSINPQRVVTVEISLDNKNLVVDSTGVIPEPNSDAVLYFNLTLKNGNDQSVKVSYTLAKNVNADNFKNALNGSRFEYGDIFQLEYGIPSNITITNFPTAPQNHTPTNTVEYFKITPNGLVSYTPPEPNKLPNTIIVKDNSPTPNKQTVATVEFNADEERLIISSTGVIPDTISLAILYFRLTIKDNNNQTVKTSFLFPMNTNADIFRDTLNGFRFQFNDILELEYAVPANITITNFPMASQNYTPTNQIEHYRITPQGLEAYTPPPGNIIIVKDTTSINPQTVVTVEINVNNKQLVVDSTGVIPEPDADAVLYFELKLKNGNDQSIKLQYTLAKNTNADNFETALNGARFEYGDILELDYGVPANINITNFPSTPQNHTPTMPKEYYKITATGLEAYTPPAPPPVPQLLPTSFSLNSYDITKEIATIKFDKTNKIFIVTSTGEAYGAPNNDDFNINFELRNATTSLISKQISRQETADSFRNDLNGENFNYGNIIVFGYPNTSIITLNDYPNLSDVYRMKVPKKQSFIITQNGVTPNILQNEIIVIDDNDDAVISLQFDKGTKKFISYNPNDLTVADGGATYFVLTLLQSDGTTAIKSSTIPGNNNGAAFITDFNGEDFEFGNVIKLQYDDRAKVVITNFPDTSNPKYNPNGTSQWFTISENGLVEYSPTPVFLNNEIMLRSANNASSAVTIQFDTISKKLKVISDGSSIDNFNNFSFVLKNSAGVRKIDSTMTGGSNGNKFVSTLNDVSFDFSDTVQLSTPSNYSILISNLPIVPNNYFLTSNPETLTIEPTGLKILPTSSLFNAQILNNIVNVFNTNDNDIVASVYFDITNNRLIAYSSDKFVDSRTPNEEYFAFVLKENDGTEKVEAIINTGENASNFAMKLNNVSFSLDDIITIRVNENI